MTGMSNAHGRIIFQDGLTLHGEYHGTSDIMHGQFWFTEEERNEKYSRNSPSPSCSCGRPDESVKVVSEYGGLWWWHGRACRACKCLTSGWDPYADNVVRHDVNELGELAP